MLIIKCSSTVVQGKRKLCEFHTGFFKYKSKLPIFGIKHNVKQYLIKDNNFLIMRILAKKKYVSQYVPNWGIHEKRDTLS